MNLLSVCLFVGCDECGKPKVRAVDDFAKSNINACTAPSEKLKCDTLDMLFQSLKSMNKHLKVLYFFVYA